MWSWKEPNNSGKYACCKLCGIEMASGFIADDEEEDYYQPNVNSTCLVPYVIVNGKRYKRLTIFLTDEYKDEYGDDDDDKEDEKREIKEIYNSDGRVVDRYFNNNYNYYGYNYNLDYDNKEKIKCKCCDKILERCHDCGVVYGGYHHLGCDEEKCPNPKCGSQLFVCTCTKRFPTIDECERSRSSSFFNNTNTSNNNTARKSKPRLKSNLRSKLK